jgi:hypothetical protein
MAMRMIPCLVLIGLLLPVELRAADDAAPPKTVAFVVGIQQYDQPSAISQKLNFPVADALRFYRQLGVIANLDTDRSHVLLAGPKTSDNLVKAGKTVWQDKIDTGVLVTQLQQFSRKIRNGDHVVLYFGGHGTVAADGTSLFLASDFDQDQGSGFLEYSTIRREIERQVSGAQMVDVSVSVFANWCGSGNAAVPGGARAYSAEQDELQTAWQQELLVHTIGRAKYALFPASAVGSNTYEADDLGGSVFVHHLMTLLHGGAAADSDGVIRSGKLYAKLAEALGTDGIHLPDRPDGFAADIPIGMTRTLEGEAHFLLASSLLAGARAVEPTADTAIKDDDVQERRSQAQTLLDLAADQFDMVPSRNAELGPRARLRSAQVALVNRGRVDPGELKNIVASDKLSTQEQNGIRRLLDLTPANDTFATLNEFHSHLLNSAHLGVVLVEGDSSIQSDDIREWGSLFRAYPGFQELAVLRALYLVKGLSQSYLKMSDMDEVLIKYALEGADRIDQQNEVTDMVIIFPDANILTYVDRSTDDQKIQCLSRAEECLVGQLVSHFLEIAEKRWPGKLSVIFDGAVDRNWIDHLPSSIHDAPLLVLSRERSDVRASGAIGNQMVERAFQGGMDKLSDYYQLTEVNGRNSNIPESFILDTLTWFPHGGVLDRAFLAAGQFASLDNFLLHVAAACATGPFSDCDHQSAKSQDLLQRLGAAVDDDLNRRYGEAAAAYEQIAIALDALSRESPATRDIFISGAGRTLSFAADVVRRRVTGATGKQGRRVIILPVGVERYQSPLIAGLPHVLSDLESYVTALSSMFNGASVSASKPKVDTRPVLVPTSAADLLYTLASVSAALRPQDLVVLVFSGRGVEIDGRRFLATAGTDAVVRSDAKLDENDDMTEPALVWQREGLVDLWDIAQALSGHWFLGIYDAQFTPPVLEPWRPDQVLDKHLDSVRPRELRPRLPRPGEIPVLGTDRGAVKEVAAPRDRLPARQVHVWLEGRLTQDAAARHHCLNDRPELPSAASPLAAALLANFPEQPITYRGWLHRLARDECLRGSGDDSRALVFQGDVDVPLLASGEGAEFVDYLRDGTFGRDLNLRTALAIALDVVARFPSARNHLAQAALLVALAQLHERDALLHGFDAARRSWLDDATDQFDETTSRANLEREGAGRLWPVRLELASRALDLKGDLDGALQVLRDAEPATALGQRGLARRLVKLTEEVLRRQPGEMLDRTRGSLARLLRENGGSGREAVDELDALDRAERARLAEPYRVTEPPSPALGTGELP